MNSRSSLAAGDPIQARCTKCRKITAHTIMTMADDQPATLQCSRCQHTAPFRKPASHRSGDIHKAARDEWATLRPEMDTARAADYSMTSSYKAKSLLNHPMFGLGLVQKQAGPHKMLVLFADGEKIMRCK